MSAEINSSGVAGKQETCPLPKTHRRLTEAHLLWHQTLDRYHDPDAFRANLNATIEALRNVTFVLQNEKNIFPNFEEWYGPWQARLKADPAAKWLHDARTTVVHQGELESHSTAEVRLVGWRDETVTTVRVPAETSSSAILQNPEVHSLLEKYRNDQRVAKDAAIAVERRWSIAGLAELEVLDALGKVYGLICDLVLDAHVRLRRSACIPTEHYHPDFRSVSQRTGTLECMSAGVQKRTQLFKLTTGDELALAETKLSPFFDMREVAGRYGLSEANVMAAWEMLDPVRLAEKVLYQAKRILCRDKHHERMMFIRDGQGQWLMRALAARDRTEKHLSMRSVAQLVESKGCDAIVEVGEMWSAPVESMRGRDLGSIQNAKGRGELLFVMVATRDGLARRYLTPFTRGPFGGIKLGDTRQSEGEFAAYLEPVLAVWRRQGSVQLPSGKTLPRIWEPDALDICLCGGPRRFGECCRPHIPLKFGTHETQKKIDAAISTAQFGEAEALATATVAQYVLWINQPTVITM